MIKFIELKNIDGNIATVNLHYIIRVIDEKNTEHCVVVVNDITSIHYYTVAEPYKKIIEKIHNIISV